MTAIAISAVIVAVVALMLVGVLLGYVRQLRSVVEETRASVRRLSEQPLSEQPDVVREPPRRVLAATPMTSEEPVLRAPRRAPQTGAPAGPSGHSVLSAAIGLLVVKAAALSYGLARALREDRRHEVADAMQAHLRTRRRLRRAEERRAGRSVRW